MAAEGVPLEGINTFRCTSGDRQMPRLEHPMNSAEDNTAVIVIIVTVKVGIVSAIKD